MRMMAAGNAGPRTLPAPVRAFLARNAGQLTRAARVRFRQVGEMQLKPGQWKRFSAVQEMSATRVEFVWQARFPIAPLIAMQVRDWYRSERGGLEARLLGIPLKRLRGPNVAKGEAMRYLAELPWAPPAIAANEELDWREPDASTVEVATMLGGDRIAVLLHFDEHGDIVASTADERPRDVDGRAVATPFGGEFGDYTELGGLRVPTTAVVYWELPEGRFDYFRGRLTDLTVLSS
jgi:hypothetical protein